MNEELLYRVTTVDYVVIVLYLLALVITGVVIKRLCSDSKNYFIGGHKISWWFAGASCFMMSFSAWTFTGAAGFAYRYGILAILLFAYNAIAFLFVALFLAHRCRQTRAITAMDIIRNRFGKAAEQVISWISLPMWLLLGAIWLTGFSMFLSVAFNLPIEATIVIAGAVIMLYTTTSGAWAVVATDFLQSIVLVVMIVVVAILSLIRIGGPSGFFNNLPEDHFTLLSPDHTVWWILAYFFSIFLNFTSITGAPRYLCVKDGKSARKVALMASILFLIGPVLWFIPPMAARYFFPDIAQVLPGMNNPHEGAYILMGLSVLPNGLAAILIMVVFGATVSSMGSCVTQNSAVITMNIYKPLLRPNAGDKELFLIGRIFNVIFGVLAISLALFVARGTKLDLFAWNIFIVSPLAISMAVPFFLVYWIKRAPKCAGVISMLAGVAYGVGGQYRFLLSLFGLRPDEGLEPWPLPRLIFGIMLVGGGAFLLSTLFWSWVKKPEKDEIAAFYDQMHTPIDVEREVPGAEDMSQLILIGRMVRIVGSAILLLVFVPNPLTDRLIVVATGLLIALTGQFFVRKGRQSVAKQKEETGAY